MWSIHDKRGEVQGRQVLADETGMAMYSVIALVRQQQPQVSHEGLKDGSMELVRLTVVRTQSLANYHRQLFVRNRQVTGYSTG